MLHALRSSPGSISDIPPRKIPQMQTLPPLPRNFSGPLLQRTDRLDDINAHSSHDLESRYGSNCVLYPLEGASQSIRLLVEIGDLQRNNDRLFSR